MVVTGTDPVAMDTTLLSLAWDLSRAVSVRHRINPESQVLTRTVSDSSGVVEHEQIQLEHACVSCALREDIMPTLHRLALDGRWDAIVSGLPTATEAGQLAHLLSTDSRLARHLKLSTVVAAVAAGNVVHDLLSDDLLRERGAHTNPGDDRGVGEVTCAQVEFADVVVLAGDADDAEMDLVRALARPDAQHVTGTDLLDGAALTAHRHQRSAAAAWSSPESWSELPPLGPSEAWRLDLSTPRAFHPERLLDQIERLGSGPYRSRGTFWVPTRPGSALEWSGAGGQLSIGSYSNWGRRTPHTRLIFTGLGATPPELVTAFEDLLLSPTEALLDQRSWDVPDDGLEPWLGDIRDIA